jgi:putative DNA primase/helicase
VSHDPARTLVEALERDGFDPRPIGPDSWESRCPSHKGSRRNLSIKRGDDGRALLHCQAHGCKPEAIVEALGLPMAALFPTRDGPAPKPHARPSGNGKIKTPARLFDSPEAAIAATVRKLGKPTAPWIYTDADGYEVFRVYRFDPPGARKEYRPVHVTPDGWVLGDPPGPLPLYGLPELSNSERVYVCEGEKAAKRARVIGLIATTSSHGAGSAQKTDWRPLAGKSVGILPDHDEPGERYAREVLAELARLEPPPVVRIVRLPVSGEGDDIEQWLDEIVPELWEPEQCRAELERMADAAPVEDLKAGPEPEGRTEPDPMKSRNENRPPRAGEAEALAKMALSVVELIVTPDGVTYARVPSDDHHETHPVRGTAFKRWLRHIFFCQREKPVAAEALSLALDTLDATASYRGRRATVHVRLACDPGRPADDPAYYLDLADTAWRAVEITRAGWRIVAEPPVVFCRRSGLLSLPEPKRGGKIECLRNHINVGSEDDFRLVVAWLTAALRPAGPYPVLILLGEQGCAKSTLARLLRRLVDPHITLLRCEPREVRDLMIAATHAWVVALDNLSGLPGWLSDALCRLATGGGFATRQLYTDDEEMYFDAMRPVVLNGIEDCGTRPDLLDRALVLNLPRVPEEKRREESEFWRGFDADAPLILGALLDAVSGGLRELAAVRLDRLPRMADFARWGTAVGRALGWPEGAFLGAYERNRRECIEAAVEASAVAVEVCKFMSERDSWEGSPAELLASLTETAGEAVSRSRLWPKTPRGLTGALKRLASVLRSRGIEMKRGERNAQTRPVILTKEPVAPEAGERPPQPP